MANQKPVFYDEGLRISRSEWSKFQRSFSCIRYVYMSTRCEMRAIWRLEMSKKKLKKCPERALFESQNFLSSNCPIMLITSNNWFRDLNFMKMYRNSKKSREKIALIGGGWARNFEFWPPKTLLFPKNEPQPPSSR